MKKAVDKDPLPQYDFATGVRGKYVRRLPKGCGIAVLDKDVQKLFPNSAAVNAALRALAQVMAVVDKASALTVGSKRATRKRAAAKGPA